MRPDYWVQQFCVKYGSKIVTWYFQHKFLHHQYSSNIWCVIKVFIGIQEENSNSIFIFCLVSAELLKSLHVQFQHLDPDPS